MAPLCFGTSRITFLRSTLNDSGARRTTGAIGRIGPPTGRPPVPADQHQRSSARRNLADDLLVFRIFGVPQGSILGPSTEFGIFVDLKVLLMVLLNFQNQLRTEPFLLVCEIFQVCLTYQPLEVKVDGGVS